MNSKLFKSGFLFALLLMAACSSLRTARNQNSQSSPPVVSHAPAQESGHVAEKVEVPQDGPPHSAEESLDNGARIVLKPKDAKAAKAGKAIEITDANRVADKEPAMKSSDEQAAEAAHAQAAALKRIETISEKSAANAAPAAKAAAHDASPEGVDPSQSLKWLANGNKRFVKGWLRKDGQAMKDVVRLSKAQRPHAIILSCSDSRVPPELVFDQKLGELFVVRIAGENPDANGLASIEYAIQHLGPRLLLVMGHSSCGAVKAAVGTAPGGNAGSPSLNHLVEELHPYLRDMIGPDAKPSPNFEKEGWSVAKGVAADLVNRSEIIRQAVESGHLMIKSSLYHLDSGTVELE